MPKFPIFRLISQLLAESISRLEYFNKQYQKLRESIKGKIDLSLQRFYEQNGKYTNIFSNSSLDFSNLNVFICSLLLSVTLAALQYILTTSSERYIRQFEEKLRRRENVKTKRQKRMLEISNYIDKIKNERRLEKIENYRKIAESAEKDEQERKLNYEKHKERLKEKRKKELEFVSRKKVTSILPPLVANDVTNNFEKIDVIPEEPDIIDVTNGELELEETDEEEEESISLPNIEVKMKDQKISALEKLRKMRTERSKENIKPKHAKKKKVNKLPPLTNMRNKLRLALGNQEKVITKAIPDDRDSVTPEKKLPQSKKSRRRHRKKHSKKKQKKKTAVETTQNDVEPKKEENEEPKPPTPPLKEEKPSETPKPPPPPDYLEVDLGKEHFVQHIVLEVSKLFSFQEYMNSFLIF